MSVSLDDEITNRIESIRKAMKEPCPPFPTDRIEEAFEGIENYVSNTMSYHRQTIEIYGTTGRLVREDPRSTIRRELYNFFDGKDWYMNDIRPILLRNNQIYEALQSLPEELEVFFQSEHPAHMTFRATFCDKWNAKHPKLRMTWEVNKPLSITYAR